MCGCWLPLVCPILGTQPPTQACVLTGNWTRDPLFRRPVLNPLSHTSQGLVHIFFINKMAKTVFYCEALTYLLYYSEFSREPDRFIYTFVYLSTYHLSIIYLLIICQEREREGERWNWLTQLPQDLQLATEENQYYSSSQIWIWRQDQRPREKTGRQKILL